jgi:hypothetical protein
MAFRCELNWFEIVSSGRPYEHSKENLGCSIEPGISLPAESIPSFNIDSTP